VFLIFDQDGDGRLSDREFIAIMKDRVHRGLQVLPYIKIFYRIYLMIHFQLAVVHSKRGLGCFQTLRQTGNEVCHLNPCVRELSFVKVCFYEAVEPPFSPQMILIL